MDSFFGIGIAELFFIAVIALIVLGPERLPGAMRELVKYMRYFRNLSSELTSQFSEEIKMLDDINPQKIMRELVDDPKEETAATKTVTPAKKSTPKPSTAKPSTTRSTASVTAKKPSTPKTTATKKVKEAENTAEQPAETSSEPNEAEQAPVNATAAQTDATNAEPTGAGPAEHTAEQAKSTEIESAVTKPPEKPASASSTSENSEQDKVRDDEDGQAVASKPAKTSAAEVESPSATPAARVGTPSNDSPAQEDRDAASKPMSRKRAKSASTAGDAEKPTAGDQSPSTNPSTLPDTSESSADQGADANESRSSVAQSIDDDDMNSILPPETKPAEVTPKAHDGIQDSEQDENGERSPFVERPTKITGTVSVNGKSADTEE